MRAVGVAVDIADSAAVRAAVSRVRSELGPPDILVNNAGIDVIELFVDSAEETWDKIIAVNLRGTITVTRAVLNGMIERGGGRIIHIASDAGRVGSSGEAVYSATKGGVIAFGKALAREVAQHGITVNSVCPGPTDTALLDQVAAYSQKLRDGLARAIPLRRVGQPGDIIELANWSHVDLDAGSPDNVRANKRGFRAHVRLVEMVAAGQAAEAEALWRLHLQEAENYLLLNKSMTTVLDLLG